MVGRGLVVLLVVLTLSACGGEDRFAAGPTKTCLDAQGVRTVEGGARNVSSAETTLLVDMQGNAAVVSFWSSSSDADEFAQRYRAAGLDEREAYSDRNTAVAWDLRPVERERAALNDCLRD